MRFPPILLRPPAGLPPIETTDATEVAISIVPNILLGSMLGVTMGFVGWGGRAFGILMVLALYAFFDVLKNMRHYRDDAIGVELWADGLPSGHQRAALERRGGTAALRRGRALIWSLPEMFLVATTVTWIALGADVVAPLFVSVH